MLPTLIVILLFLVVTIITTYIKDYIDFKVDDMYHLLNKKDEKPEVTLEMIYDLLKEKE